MLGLGNTLLGLGKLVTNIPDAPDPQVFDSDAGAPEWDSDAGNAVVDTDA